MKAMVRPCLAQFFLCRPLLRLPLADGLFVALDGVAARPLAGEVQSLVHSALRSGARKAVNAFVSACSVVAEEVEAAGLVAAASILRNSRRNSRESTRTGRKKPGRPDTQRCPSSAMPPPGTIICRCGPHCRRNQAATHGGRSNGARAGVGCGGRHLACERRIDRLWLPPAKAQDRRPTFQRRNSQPSNRSMRTRFAAATTSSNT